MNHSLPFFWLLLKHLFPVVAVILKIGLAKRIWEEGLEKASCSRRKMSQVPSLAMLLLLKPGPSAHFLSDCAVARDGGRNLIQIMFKGEPT